MSTAGGGCALESFDVGGNPDMIDVHVLLMTGDEMVLRIPGSTLGREVRQMVAEKVTSKPGRKLVLHHGVDKLVLCQSLHGQGCAGTVALTCTFCKTDLYAA